MVTSHRPITAVARPMGDFLPPVKVTDRRKLLGNREMDARIRALVAREREKLEAT